MARKVADSPLFKVQQVLQHTIAGVLQNRVDRIIRKVPAKAAALVLPARSMTMAVVHADPHVASYARHCLKLMGVEHGIINCHTLLIHPCSAFLASVCFLASSLSLNT
jgi:hypothetical protein